MAKARKSKKRPFQKGRPIGPFRHVVDDAFYFLREVIDVAGLVALGWFIAVHVPHLL